MKENSIKVWGKLHSMESMGLVDGPGNRTLFFLQGCPLRCAYCHNPDAITTSGGKEITPEDILKTARRYRTYHGEEGGITFSGGEPLLQGDFLYEALEKLKNDGFNTCVDTSGIGNPKYYSKIMPLIDVMLLDVKAFDEESFKDICQGDLSVYLKFIRDLEKYGFQGMIWARHVMVPGLTDNKESMEKFVEILEPVKNRVERIEILPYHTAGVKKYEELKIPYRLEGVEPMDKDKAKELEIYTNKYFTESLHKERVEEAKKKQKKAKNILQNERDLKEKDKALIEEIKSLPLLKGISSEKMEEVLKEIHIIKKNTNDYVFQTDDEASYMYLILKGQVKIFYNTIDGKEQIFYIYRDQDFVGGLNLLEHESYLYNGQALTDCEIISIPREVFEEYILTNPESLKIILKMSFERIRWAEDLIQRLSTSNASMKTAGLLLRLKNSIGVETEEGIKLELSLNREELGNYSGLTRETVTRKLGEFKELGYIDLIGNKIILIKDLEALEDFVF
ncbi:pyruvate formate-lyase-activating protein [Gallicola sp. Sow4_E12]|uniref:pyruvate formate-lyase-activating protein n=1 Tax=Gallicola sp. Sow4_E12 TaxID=3438785 RepID=UPI003F8FEAD9